MLSTRTLRQSCSSTGEFVRSVFVMETPSPEEFLLCYSDQNSYHHHHHNCQLGCKRNSQVIETLRNALKLLRSCRQLGCKSVRTHTISAVCSRQYPFVLANPGRYSSGRKSPSMVRRLQYRASEAPRAATCLSSWVGHEIARIAITPETDQSTLEYIYDRPVSR